MRIVFAGTPDFAVPALDALAAAGHELAAVYTQPDRPAGRGRKLQPSPVKQRAVALGLPVEQPASLNDSGAFERLRSYRPDLLVVVAYGLLLPRPVLELPRHGCINIHASLLPRWRGAAPIQRAIAAGDAETGISIMQMDAGLDTGPVLLARTIPIAPGETGGELHDRLAALGAEAVVEALGVLEAGALRPVPQPDTGMTYAAKLDKAEAEIDWAEPAAVIERQVRAFNPWPVAFTRHDGETLRIWAGQALPARGTEAPGTVVAADKAGIDVTTGAGIFRIQTLQRPGGKKLGAQEFVNGRSLRGTVFG